MGNVQSCDQGSVATFKDVKVGFWNQTFWFNSSSNTIVCALM